MTITCVTELYNYYVTQFGLVADNNFEQICIFQHLLFGTFIQEAN